MTTEKLIEIITKVQKGDSTAMDTLITETYKDIYYYVLKTVKDEDLAYDVTQESFVEIITTIENLREPAAFPLWSRRIAYHKCALHFRQSKDILAEEDEDSETIFDKMPDESEDSLPEAILEDKEFRESLMNMINSLPPEQTNALLLYYYEKRSVGEIAEIQGVSQGTVKSRLNYARKAIKNKVEEHEAKTGTKLYSFALLPLLYFIFQSEKVAVANIVNSSAITSAITSNVVNASANASATANAVNSVATASTVSNTVNTAAVTTATATTAKTVGSAIATKIIAGIVAASLVAGGAVFAIHKATNKEDNNDPTTSTEIRDSIDNSNNEQDDTNLDLEDASSNKEGFMFAGTWREIPQRADDITAAEYVVIDKEGKLTWYSPDEDTPVEGAIYTDIFKENDDGHIIFRFDKFNSSYNPEITFIPNGDYYGMESSMSYFYREEDNIGYDVVDLTPENFSQYIETVPQMGHITDAYGDISRIYDHTNVRFKEGLGPASYIIGELNYKKVYKDVIYDPSTKTCTPSETLDTSDTIYDRDFMFNLFEEFTDSIYASDHSFENNGDGTYSVSYVAFYDFVGAERILGKVYVPKGWQG